MRRDYSAPVTMPRSSRTTIKSSQRGQKATDEKQVDYSHLDIVAEIERLTGCSLRHVSKAEYAGRCPFPGCPSMNDGFRVWDRPELDLTRDGKREKHFWCRRCGRSGDLIALIRQYKEAMTGEHLSWSEAALSLSIDPRTWRAIADGDEQPCKSSTRSEKRRQQEAQREKTGQAEIDLLSAWYTRARAWLASGEITLKDGRTISLETARAYLQERGFSLAQSARLGLAYIPTAKELPEIATIPEAAILVPWRGRILFPLYGPKDVHGFAGRSLLGWKVGMSAEYHKQQLNAWNETHQEKQVQRYRKTYQAAHYGYDEACSAKTLVVVEGEFDAASVRLALAGLADIAVCAFGTNFQARLIPLNVLHVVLALDADGAGQDAIARQSEELEMRGATVQIVHPPEGKDWNACHLLGGLEAIRSALIPQPQKMTAQNERYLSDNQPLGDTLPYETPPNYDSGYICLSCGKEVENRLGAFHVVEERDSPVWGDMFCMECWEAGYHEPCGRLKIAQHEQPKSLMSADEHIQLLTENFEEDCSITMLPSSLSPEAYIEQWYQRGHVLLPASKHVRTVTDEHHCPKHGKPYAYSDEHGGRYCANTDCWQRYRLIRAGANRGYPALSVIDPRDHLADTSKEPLYWVSGIPIYPTRPAISRPLIADGADAWKTYISESHYQDIDQAIRAFIS